MTTLWVLACLLLLAPVAGAGGTVEATASAGYLAPVGSDVVDPGAAARIGVGVGVGPWLKLQAEAGVDYLPLGAGGLTLPVTIRGGPATSARIGNRLRLLATVQGGGYLAPVLGSPYPVQLGGGPLVEVAAGVEGRLTPSFGMIAGLRWGWQIGLHHGLASFVGIRWAPPGASGVEVRAVDLGPVFPALYASGRKTTVGGVRLLNRGPDSVVVTEALASVPGYAPVPSVTPVQTRLRPGESVDLQVNLDFGYRLMQVTGSHDVVVEFLARYTHGRTIGEVSAHFPLHVLDRNSLVWDDTDKACLFVTEKDPDVAAAMGAAVAALRRRGRSLISDTFLHAVAALALLDAIPVNYARDPITPYEQVSAGEAVDHLRFPRESIRTGIGDCDDLAVLYCALLESVGIRTALVTVPGHIFAAVGLEMDRGVAVRTMASGDRLLLHEGDVWLPVETTITGDFAKAWTTGFRQWIEAHATNSARFHPVRAAWEKYPPVSLRTAMEPTSPIDAMRLDASLERLARIVVLAELEPLEAAYLERLQEGTASPEHIYNAVGILRARYGELEDAAAAFREAVKIAGDSSASTNLANTLVMLGEYEEALELYARRLDRDEQDTAALLGRAVTLYRLERLTEARADYDELERADEEVARRHAYVVTPRELDSPDRAILYTEELLWRD